MSKDKEMNAFEEELCFSRIREREAAQHANKLQLDTVRRHCSEFVSWAGSVSLGLLMFGMVLSFVLSLTILTVRGAWNVAL